MFAELTTKRVLAALCAFVLALTMLAPCGVRLAAADEVKDAQAALDKANEKLDGIANDYQALKAEAASLDSQIEKATDSAVKAQDAMVAYREKLGQTILAAYKTDVSLVDVLIASENLGDFLKNMEYFSIIQEDQAAVIAEQKRLSDIYEDTVKSLNEKKDAQAELLEKAEQKYNEAQNLVGTASANLSAAQKKALEAKAKALKENESAPPSKKVVENWNTNTEGGSANSAVIKDTPAKQEESKKEESKKDEPAKKEESKKEESSSSGSASTPSGAGWKTGLASAYGGSSDPTTPNPGITALGAVCNDHSMGVAIPMSWSNYRSYLGRRVEISYGGKTVIATVNDCGYMSGGARSLDLQPGVFKSFGFSTCRAWGVRSVSYRFL